MLTGRRSDAFDDEDPDNNPFEFTEEPERPNDRGDAFVVEQAPERVLYDVPVVDLETKHEDGEDGQTYDGGENKERAPPPKRTKASVPVTEGATLPKKSTKKKKKKKTPRELADAIVADMTSSDWGTNDALTTQVPVASSRENLMSRALVMAGEALARRRATKRMHPLHKIDVRLAGYEGQPYGSVIENDKGANAAYQRLSAFYKITDGERDRFFKTIVPASARFAPFWLLADSLHQHRFPRDDRSAPPFYEMGLASLGHENRAVFCDSEGRQGHWYSYGAVKSALYYYAKWYRANTDAVRMEETDRRRCADAVVCGVLRDTMNLDDLVDRLKRVPADKPQPLVRLPCVVSRSDTDALLAALRPVYSKRAATQANHEDGLEEITANMRLRTIQQACRDALFFHRGDVFVVATALRTFAEHGCDFGASSLRKARTLLEGIVDIATSQTPDRAKICRQLVTFLSDQAARHTSFDSLGATVDADYAQEAKVAYAHACEIAEEARRFVDVLVRDLTLGVQLRPDVQEAAQHVRDQLLQK